MLNRRGAEIAARAAAVAVLVAASLARGDLAQEADPPVTASITWSAPSELLAIAEGVSVANDWERADFARIAISRMAAQYHDVLQRLDALPSRAKHTRWRAATARFVDELERRIDEIDRGASVAIHVDPRVETLLMLIDGKSVLFGGPDGKRQEKLEQELLASYCRVNDCLDTRLALDPVPSAIPTEQQHGGWSVVDGHSSTFETEDGLHFMFTSLDARQRKQEASLEVAGDLRRLAEHLKRAGARGQSIEWDVLKFVRGAGGGLRVQINRRGDWIELSLPAMERVSDIWDICVPWLRAQVERRRYVQFFPRSDLLLQELL